MKHTCYCKVIVAIKNGEPVYKEIVLCPLHEAAPKLLEAAKLGLSALIDCGLEDEDGSGLMMKIRSAIAKAEGSK